MSNGKPRTRYISLFDEIWNHVFQWATDEDWSKLSPKVNTAICALMNELKISRMMQESGEKETDEDSITMDKRRFVALFKKRYVELTKFKFEDKITPITQVNMANAINRLKSEGGKYEEFLDWFFDEYCSLEENKKFMPPQLNYVCSHYVVNKYLYKMKDSLQMRKDNLDREKVRTMLLEIALPMQQRLRQSNKHIEFAKKILEFDNRNISGTKFLSIMKAFAKKYDDKEGMEACEKISEKLGGDSEKTGDDA